jgi:hypothetical protein
MVNSILRKLAYIDLGLRLLVYAYWLLAVPIHIYTPAGEESGIVIDMGFPGASCSLFAKKNVVAHLHAHTTRSAHSASLRAPGRKT